MYMFVCIPAGFCVAGRSYCARNDLQICAYCLERDRLNEYISEGRKDLNIYFIFLSLSLWFPFIVDFQISHMYFLCHLTCFMASHRSQKSRTLNSDLSLYTK